jgi:beta-galactosidase
MRECFFRAPTDIDHGITHLSYGHRWLEAGLDDLVHEARCVEAAAPGASAAVVRVEKTVRPRRGGEGVRCRSVFTVFGSGDVLLEATVDAHPSLPPLPRIGMELALPLAFDRFAWFGRGPHECYPDRKRSAWVGLHETTVAEAETPYIFPQECGGREDVRRLTLTDAEGAGLLVVGEPTVHASALPHHWRDLHEAKTRRELPDPSAVHLHVDGFMTGLGGDTGWFPNIHPPYLLRPGRYRYAFRLRALRPGEDAAALARRSVG